MKCLQYTEGNIIHKVKKDVVHVLLDMLKVICLFLKDQTAESSNCLNNKKLDVLQDEDNMLLLKLCWPIGAKECWRQKNYKS